MSKKIWYSVIVKDFEEIGSHDKELAIKWMKYFGPQAYIEIVEEGNDSKIIGEITNFDDETILDGGKC